MLNLLSRPYAGAAAQLIIQKLFLLQGICVVIALAHLATEYIYLGRHVARDLIIVVLVLLCLISAGGLWLQPRLKNLHLTRYSPRTTQIQKMTAEKSFGAWHGVAQGMNILGLLGQLYYFYRLQSSMSSPRFVPTNKFRG